MRYCWLFLGLCFFQLSTTNSGWAQEAERKAAITYLQKLQRPDGGFAPVADPNLQGSLRATSAAIRALKYLGGEASDPKAATQFVLSCYDPKSGTFQETPKGKGDLFVTAVGLMAMAELKIVDADITKKAVDFLVKSSETFEDRRIAVAGCEATGSFPAVVQEWNKTVSKTKNEDGTYGKGLGQARATGSVVAMILRSGGTLPDAEKKAVIQALKAGQRKDGGYGKEDSEASDLETTYRVMRAFHLLQEKPDHIDTLQSYLAKCRNEDGGYGIQPGKPSTAPSTYYVAIISKWLK